ncbi:MAG: MATE family efflux transporter [Candidatus Caenarcaniphilales bacterium]|nr:MATE family efflux transporter [Candidatus Caenarcaniphilales bacterium]
MTKAKLTVGPVGKTLKDLTIPMIWGIFAMITFNMVDTYFVGQLGTLSLAAMSLTFPVVMVINFLLMGLGIGLSSGVALAIGEGNRHKVQRLTTDGLVLSFLIVCLCIIIGICTIEPLFQAIGATKQMLPLIEDYMKIWYLGGVFAIAPLVGNFAIRATGNSHFPGVIMMIASVINVVLDPLLIFGYAGFPRMELQGAALATIISWSVTFFASGYVMIFKEHLISLEIPRIKEVIVSWKRILHVGLPAAGTNTIIPLSNGIIMSLLASFGKETIAAFGVSMRIEAFALIVLYAISSIIGPFVGQNWGAKKYGRVDQGLSLIFKFCMLWGVFLAISLGFGSKFLVEQFDKNEEVVDIASLYFWIVPISYGLNGITMMVSAVFNSLHKPISATILSVTRMFVLYVPLAYLGKIFWGVNGIFAAYSLANIVVGVIAYRWNAETLKSHSLQMNPKEEDLAAVR